MAKKNSMKSNTAKRVVGLGGCFLDFVCPVSDEFVAELADGGKGSTVHCTHDRFVELLSRLPQEKIVRRCGGGVGTTLRRLSRKSVSTLMLTAVGDDEEGRIYIDALKAEGVDTSRIRVIPGEHTGLCIALVTPDGERTMRTCRGINDRLGKYVSLRKADLASAEILYSEGYLMSEEEFLKTNLRIGHEMGVDVLFDVGSSNMILAHQSFLKNTLRQYVTVFFANQDEAATLVGTPDPYEAALKMNQFYGLSFVKCGSDGAIYVDRNGVPQLVSPMDMLSDGNLKERLSQNVDSTGAGDAWAAGFIHCYLEDMSIQMTVEMANMEATFQLLENQVDHISQLVKGSVG